jgi:hypothetical protein
MIIFRNISLVLALLLSSSLTANVAGQNKDKPQDDIVTVYKEFSALQDDAHSYLRRHLVHETLVCRTDNPVGMVDGGDCGSRDVYSCTCTDDLVDRKTCSYCPGFTTTRNKEFCQQTGSSTTYFDRDTGTVRTCSCDYDPVTGLIKQDCHIQTEPIPDPPGPFPVPPPSPSPGDDRGDEPGGGPGIPLPNPQEELTCLTDSPVGLVDGNCGSRADYNCTCIGADLISRQMCSYCPALKTARHRELCLQTGRSTTYFDRDDRVVKTCHCDFDPITGAFKNDCHLQSDDPVIPPPTPDPGDDRGDEPGGGPGIPLPTRSCKPDVPFNYNIPVCFDPGNDPEFCDKTVLECNSMFPRYSCTCGDTKSECSYCKVRTAQGVVCQVTGNTMTFRAPDQTTQTCFCESTENGGARSACSGPAQTPQVSYSEVFGNMELP